MKKIRELLLVDDSESANLFNKNLLKEMEVAKTIKSFSDARVALTYLKEIENPAELPELILLDLSMPKMDGFKFLEEYTKLNVVVYNDFETVIAIVSNHLDFENFERAKTFKNCGVLEHIKKPMDQEDITNLIEEHLYK